MIGLWWGLRRKGRKRENQAMTEDTACALLQQDYHTECKNLFHRKIQPRCRTLRTSKGSTNSSVGREVRGLAHLTMSSLSIPGSRAMASLPISSTASSCGEGLRQSRERKSCKIQRLHILLRMFGNYEDDWTHSQCRQGKAIHAQKCIIPSLYLGLDATT